MSVYDKLHGGPKGSSGEPRNLSARQYLGLEGNDGYTTTASFIAYATSLRKGEVTDLDNIIGWMKAGHPIDDQNKTREDKGGRKYAYPRFRISIKSAPGGKVIPEAGIDRLLNDYAANLIQVDFTLDELVEVALNA